MQEGFVVNMEIIKKLTVVTGLLHNRGADLSEFGLAFVCLRYLIVGHFDTSCVLKKPLLS